MKFNTVKKLLIESGDYAGDIHRDPHGQFIGFVYAKNYKYSDEDLQRHLAIPIQCEE